MHRTHHRQAIKLWYPPLVSVDSLTYIDQSGNPQTLTAGTDFQVDPESEPAIIQPLPNQIWPFTMHGVKNAVQVVYTAGYETGSAERVTGESDSAMISEPEYLPVAAPNPPMQVAAYRLNLTIPEELVLGVKQLCLHKYQNRDLIISTPGAGGKHEPLPEHIEETIADYMQKDFTASYYPREVESALLEPEPVSRASVKAFCRITTTNDDNLIDTLIVASRRRLERATWRSLKKKQYLQSFDQFPCHIWPGTRPNLYEHNYY
jgi:hypothetical protein